MNEVDALSMYTLVFLHFSSFCFILKSFLYSSNYKKIGSFLLQRKLDTAVLYRSNVANRLELSVTNLDQLNSALHLLEELRDMENKIDEIYLPIENMYSRLR